jgi:hypothetical protein
LTPGEYQDVLDVEDWAEIRRLHRGETLSIKAIVRRLGVSRNTVRKALSGHGPPRYRRASAGSIVDAVEPQIRGVVDRVPGDAVDGVDGTGRLVAGEDGVLRPGAAVAAVVQAGRTQAEHVGSGFRRR